MGGHATFGGFPNEEEDKDYKPIVQLEGTDGNAFAIIGKCRKAAKQAGWSNQKIEQVSAEMKAGDYDSLLQTAMKYFEVE